MFKLKDVMIAGKVLNDLLNGDIKDVRSYSLTKTQKDAVKVIFEKDTRKLRKEERILNETWEDIKQKGVSANAK